MTIRLHAIKNNVLNSFGQSRPSSVAVVGGEDEKAAKRSSDVLELIHENTACGDDYVVEEIH